MARSGGGLGGSLKNLAWAFIVACIAVAMFRGALSNPQGFYNDLKVKSAHLEQTVKGWVNESGLNKGAPAPATTPAPHTSPAG